MGRHGSNSNIIQQAFYYSHEEDSIVINAESDSVDLSYFPDLSTIPTVRFYSNSGNVEFKKTIFGVEPNPGTGEPPGGSKCSFTNASFDYLTVKHYDINLDYIKGIRSDYVTHLGNKGSFTKCIGTNSSFSLSKGTTCSFTTYKGLPPFPGAKGTIGKLTYADQVIPATTYTTVKWNDVYIDDIFNQLWIHDAIFVTPEAGLYFITANLVYQTNGPEYYFTTLRVLVNNSVAFNMGFNYLRDSLSYYYPIGGSALVYAAANVQMKMEIRTTHPWGITLKQNSVDYPNHFSIIKL